MPLGFFGGSSNNGPKPQPLNSEKEKKYKDVATTSAGADIKDCKGSTVKVGKKSYVVEKKLAEGGYAIVYQVCDKHSRCYALKRQLIRDDPRQVEACKTESQIVKNLNGHANIVGYVDHSLTVNKTGIYDYMLLTLYYKSNVLQLMNSRLLANRYLNVDEILAIFCDVCEAVARLHHSKTPVIHRDLKVENILVDERTGTERPVYVLCDFGSATTKVMSRETHTQVQLEEEIKKYTTLSYRAPEMIDLFSNIPIDTKSDIWALGVLLYKLCYFALPFGESALAIQNGAFTFPENPDIPEEIKAIINLLLTSSAKHRPNIYQCSYLAFAAARRKCPVYNIEKCPRIELTEAVEILRLRDKLGSNYARRFEKALNDFEERKNREKSMHIAAAVLAKQNLNVAVAADRQSNASPNPSAKSPSTPANPTAATALPSSDTSLRDASMNQSMQSWQEEGMIVNTTDERRSTLTTSVNPRLRPKASSNVSSIFPPPVTASPRLPCKSVGDHPSTTAPSVHQRPPPATNSTTVAATMTTSTTTTPRATVPLQQFEQMKVSQISTDSSKSAPTDEQQQRQMSNSVYVDTTLRGRDDEGPRSSAFHPYSMSAKKSSTEAVDRPPVTAKSASVDAVRPAPESSNPFIAHGAGVMDDKDFGEHFDQLRRGVNRRNTVVSVSSMPERRLNSMNGTHAAVAAPPPVPAHAHHHNYAVDSYLERTIEEDPFGAAPILPQQILMPPKVSNNA